MASSDENSIIRIALIGKTGVGKSSLGNTILGQITFDSSIGGESETITCASAVGQLRNGGLVKVVDTPGIMDTRGKEDLVRKEVTKAIGYLSPGPHAFIIVLTPGRTTKEEKQALKDLRGLFGNESFLNYTIIVMVRKNDIRDKQRNPMNIHEYINTWASEETKELYRQCGRRIVAVENNGSDEELKQYAMDVIDEIGKLGGQYFSHDYFKAMQELKIREEELKKKDEDLRRMQQKLQEIAAKDNNSFCTML